MELINKDNLSSLHIGDLLYRVTFNECVEVIFDGELDDGIHYYYDEWDDDLCRSIRRDRYVHISDLDDWYGSIALYRGTVDKKILMNERINLLQREISRLTKLMHLEMPNEIDNK